MLEVPKGDIRALELKQLAPRNGVTAYQGRPVSHTCPHCNRAGTFDAAQDWQYQLVYDTGSGQYAAQVGCSVRFCPNPSCHAPVFLVTTDGEVLHSLPQPKLDFDATRLPEQIASCLEEAIACHASGCYRACALLVRRTIEEVCKEKGATGGNLKARIEKLGSVMTLPAALMAAMNELRLLGNDAAHVDASEYDEIGAQEAVAAVMLAKEIVKAAYQYDNLLEALSNLKRGGGAA